MLKGLIQSRNIREENDLQNQPQTIKKMAIGTYISIITLNVNGSSAPKIYRMDTKTRFCKKPTSDLLSFCRMKVWDEKIYSMQMGSKRKLE